MYTTRPLSHFSKFPDSLSTPPDGPNSGYLVIQDEESETYSCFGLCKNHSLKDLPFPQNKNLTVLYTQSNGENSYTSYDDVVLIPVLNLPLSANRYYAISAHGKHKGEAWTCSREEDMTTCCFCRCVKDVKPMPLDLRNIYQQIEISDYPICNGKGHFHANSIAPDGFPPYFLRRKGWRIRGKTPKDYKLGEAQGLDAALRALLPDFTLPLSLKCSDPVIVGKWYCPFMFIKEWTLRYQMETSMYYQITLEQRWEQIYTCTNTFSEGSSVHIDVSLDKEIAYVGGGKARWDERDVVDGKIMFRNSYRLGEEASVGLSVELVHRMKWEQKRGGLLDGVKGQERVVRKEDFGGNGQWKGFGCYVLVENFVIRRLDGNLLMAYDFWHTEHIRSKWL